MENHWFYIMLLVPRKVDNCVRKFAKSPGRNSEADVSRLLTRTTSPHRNRNSFPARRLVHEVMTLATFSGPLIRSASPSPSSSSSMGLRVTHRPHHCGLIRGSINWHVREQRDQAVAGSELYQSHLSFPLPPIPVLNIVTNSNNADDKEIEYIVRGVCAIKIACMSFAIKPLANYVII